MTTLIVQPNRPVYLDYAATTPVDQRVAAKMIPYLSERFGNPASRSHAYGWAAEEAVELALAAVGGDTTEIAAEAADVLYHLLVLLQASGVSLAQVCAVLASREGVSGIAEKASRKK